MSFSSPRDALDAGIATVYQDLAMIPLMSVTRNFFMGREPRKGVWPFRYIDFDHCDDVTREEMHKIGIDMRDPAPGRRHAVGRRAAMRRHRPRGLFRRQGADPRRADLGARRGADLDGAEIHPPGAQKGLGVIFITHNVRHAYAVGDRFTVLNRGKTLGTYAKGEITIDELQNLMAGGKELQALSSELGGTV